MGGMTIMAFAGRHPETLTARVAGVALLSTSSGRLSDSTFGLPRPAGWLVPRVTPIVFERMLTRGALIDRNNLPVTRYVAFGARAAREHVRFVSDMAVATPTEVMVGFFRAFLVHDKLAALAALRQVETLVVLPEAGHMIGLERPETVNRALSELLDRAVRRTGDQLER